MKRTVNNIDYKEFEPDPAVYPTPERTQAFNRSLKNKSLTPEDVLFRKSSSFQRTVFCDLVGKGTGLASFIHIWMSSANTATTQKAKDELAHAALFHIYRLRDAPSRFRFTDKNGSDYAVDLRSTTGQEVDFVYDVSGGMGETDYHSDSDRLVPSYDISQKGSGKIIQPKNVERTSKIKAQLKSQVQSLRR